ncbi:hypothetical protein CH063_11363, partial [Colletotrichum higginsianum]
IQWRGWDRWISLVPLKSALSSGCLTDECRRRHICAVGEGNSNHSPVFGTKTWMTAQDDNETGVDH